MGSKRSDSKRSPRRQGGQSWNANFRSTDGTLVVVRPRYRDVEEDPYDGSVMFSFTQATDDDEEAKVVKVSVPAREVIRLCAQVSGCLQSDHLAHLTMTGKLDPQRSEG